MAKAKRDPNPLRLDPSRTTMLRRNFERALVSKFLNLSREVVELIGKQDVLGLTANYSAGQPRDSRGRFGSGGGGGGGGGSSKPTDSKAFKEWFGKSKIVDENGEPLTVYHGTTVEEDFNEFAVGDDIGMDTEGAERVGSGGDPTTYLGSHFAKEPEVASKFAEGLYGERVGDKVGGRVMPVHLKIEKPYKTTENEMQDAMLATDQGNHPWVEDTVGRLGSAGDMNEDQSWKMYDADVEWRMQANRIANQRASSGDYGDTDLTLSRDMADDYRSSLQNKGYDGIEYKNEVEGGTSYVVFEGTQVKSASGNRGTYDPKDSNIANVENYSAGQPRDSRGRFGSGGGGGGAKLAPDTGGGSGGGRGGKKKLTLKQKQAMARKKLSARAKAKSSKKKLATEKKAAEERTLFENRVARTGEKFNLPEGYEDEYVEWADGLTNFEKKSIASFTGMSYAAVRKHQSKGGGNATIKNKVKAMKKLEDAPRVEGTIYRGLTFKTEADRKAFMAKKGMTTKTTDSTSAFQGVARSRAEAVSKLGSPAAAAKKSYPLMMEVRAKTAVDIAPLSRHPNEREAVMLPKTRLKKVGVRETKNGPVVIYEDMTPVANVLTENVSWKFKASHKQLQLFQLWLAKRIQADILLGASATEDAYWDQYVKQGFAKGAGRAFADTKTLQKKGEALAATEKELDFYKGSKSQFLQSSFGRPVAKEKVKLLASRVYTDLNGVTQAMATVMSRTLTDGLVQGKHPREIARDLAKNVTGIGINRARIIAQTEIMRAHAEGQLDAMRLLGVQQVGAMVEWSTAGDGRVCGLCLPLGDTVLTLDEAEGLLPRHPRCRCTWIPANVGEDKEKQKRSRASIQAAITKSLRAELPKKAKGKGAKSHSSWGGATKPITKKRPKALV